jgi:ABC-type tungstate transport system substrate-binding protein
MATQNPSPPITRADLESKFRELEGDVTEQVESARSTAITVGVIVAVLLAFLLGSRKGRKRSTVVEIRRV